MRLKIPIKISKKSRRRRVKIRYLALVAAAFAVCFPAPFIAQKVAAADCADVKLVFARGSGEKYNSNVSFQTLSAALANKVGQTSLTYRAIDLPYPAVEVGLGDVYSFAVTLGAMISGGENFRFASSVATGVDNLVGMVNSDACPNSKYVLAGYSQGAMVVDKALPRVDQSKIIYTATFGDPKIYLPEGRGPMPEACRGENLSDYRVHVPDCHAYEGLLGAYIPYRPDSMAGRVGTWCNNHDIFCSSSLNFNDHEGYIRNNLYEDASRVIFGKINQAFNLKSNVASVRDTAILIDSTGSMQPLIDQYKSEALRLAKETFDSGGRVALYDYRDLNDHYQPVEHCNFDNCDFATFERELNNIAADGGGDSDESLLSASLKIMQTLKWKVGATKSLVVLTDSGFHAPDLDGTSLEQVVQTSKKIDPVNFYIITNPESGGRYVELATRTDGKVVTNMNGLSLLTDYIMERYDTLPRVEESVDEQALPSLSIDGVEWTTETSAHIRCLTNASKILVILNDDILGVTDQTEFTLTDLNPAYENTLTLVPLTDSLRGESASAILNSGISLDDYIFSLSPATPLPKAPNSASFDLNLIWQGGLLLD